MTTVDELYILAQLEVSEMLRDKPDKDKVLEAIFSNYRKNTYYERKVELLKQYCLEHGITGVTDDVELYNSSSASFEFNDDVLKQELKDAEEKVKDLKTKLKKSSTTTKINKPIICIGKKKEIRDNIQKVQ